MPHSTGNVPDISGSCSCRFDNAARLVPHIGGSVPATGKLSSDIPDRAGSAPVSDHDVGIVPAVAT